MTSAVIERMFFTPTSSRPPKIPSRGKSRSNLNSRKQSFTSQQIAQYNSRYQNAGGLSMKLNRSKLSNIKEGFLPPIKSTRAAVNKRLADRRIILPRQEFAKTPEISVILPRKCMSCDKTPCSCVSLARSKTMNDDCCNSNPVLCKNCTKPACRWRQSAVNGLRPITPLPKLTEMRKLNKPSSLETIHQTCEAWRPAVINNKSIIPPIHNKHNQSVKSGSSHARTTLIEDHSQQEITLLSREESYSSNSSTSSLLDDLSDFNEEEEERRVYEAKPLPLSQVLFKTYNNKED